MGISFENNIYKIIFFLLLIALLLFFGNADMLKIGLIGGVILLLVVVTNIQLTLIILVVIAFTFNYLMAVRLLPGKMVYAYDFIIYIMLLYSLINGNRKIHVIEVFVLLYVAFLTVSFLLGREVFPLKMKGFVMYVRYPILIITLLRLNLDSNTYKTIIKFIIFMAFLQVPTSMLQYSMGNRADWCGGFLSLYGSGVNAVLMTMMFLLVLAVMIVDKIRKRYILISVFLMIPLVLSSARAGFIFFIVSIIFTVLIYMLHIKYSSVYAFFFTIIGIVVILFAFYYTLLYIVPIFEPKNANTVSLITSPDMIKNDVTGTYTGGQLKRFSSIMFAYNYLNKDILSITFGSGPGTSAISANFGKSSFMQQYEWIFDPTVSLPGFTLELGLAGVISWIFLLFYVISFSLNRAIHIEDKFLRVIAFALPGMSVIMIVSSAYTSVWDQEALQLVYWVMVASIIEPAYKAVKKNKVSALILMKELGTYDKPSIQPLISALYNYEIKNIFIAGRENDTNMLWLIDNVKKYEDLKIRWIRIMGYESFSRSDVLNMVLNQSKTDLIIIDGSDMHYDQRILKRFIDTHRNAFALDFEDAEKKRVNYSISKIKQRSLIKLSYYLRDINLSDVENPLVEIFNNSAPYGVEFQDWTFLFEESSNRDNLEQIENES